MNTGEGVQDAIAAPEGLDIYYEYIGGATQRIQDSVAEETCWRSRRALDREVAAVSIEQLRDELE